MANNYRRSLRDGRKVLSDLTQLSLTIIIIKTIASYKQAYINPTGSAHSHKWFYFP